jgi:hypothetical protein
VTGIQQVDTDEDDDVGELLTMYRRLAAMDPPALRSLAAELARFSDESSASAALQVVATLSVLPRRRPRWPRSTPKPERRQPT